MTTEDRIIQAIKDLWEQNGYAPTLRELGDACGIASKSTVKKHLGRLHQQGRVSLVPGSPRTVRVS